MIIVGEGGEDQEMTPIQAADWFAEKYLPFDFDKQSISLPLEVVDLGLPTQGVILPDAEREKIMSSLKRDKNVFKEHGEQIRGAQNEIAVLKYIQKSMNGPSALFWSYSQLKTYRFLGIQEMKRDKHENGCLDEHGVPIFIDWFHDQEFDIILLLPEHKLFVVVEVKSYNNRIDPNTLDPLINGKQFFTDLQKYIGVESWNYIPIVALPNVETRDKAENVELKQKLDFVTVTAEEMKADFMRVLLKNKNITKVQPNCPTDETYKTLVKFLYASAHSEPVSKSTGNVGLQLIAPDDPADKTHELLVGKDGDVVSAGFPKEVVKHLEKVTFSDLKQSPLGDMKCMIFWNPEQFKVIHTTDKKLMIVGEYGTGKTLLIMKKVERSLSKEEEVMFVCDSINSSAMFNCRIRSYCEDKNITFASINLKDERNNFEDLLKNKNKFALVIDELEPGNFSYVCSATKDIQQVTCVINPGITMTEVDGLTVPEDWCKVQLSCVMRNSTSVYNAATGFTNSSVAGVNISTVLGTKPQMIFINSGFDYYIGLITALNLMKNEDKIVIINSPSSDVNDITIYSALKCTRPDLPIYHSSREDEIKQFLDSPKGCYIAGGGHDFRGMETKNLILIFGATDGTTKEKSLRCTTQLVLIKPTNYGFHTNTEYWDIIVPYQEQSDSYKQCIGSIKEHYPDTEYKRVIDNIPSTRLRINYTQFTESEVKQLMQEQHRELDSLLDEPSTKTRLERIQALSAGCISELLYVLDRSIEEETSDEKERKEMLQFELEAEKDKKRKVIQLTKDLLNEFSTESRLKRIQALSKYYIRGLLIELERSIGKESSAVKTARMQMLQAELRTGYNRREEMIEEMTEDLLNESSTESRLKRIQALSTDYIVELFWELGLCIDKESSEEKLKRMRKLEVELKQEYTEREGVDMQKTLH